MLTRSASLLICFCILGFLKTGGDAPPGAALQAIEAAEIGQHLNFLAADSMLGRNTPSPELEKVAAYISRYFASIGIKPLTESYLQPFALNQIFLGDTSACHITTAAATREYVLKKEFMPYEMTANQAASGEIVFAGYGISAPELGYDDYRDVDVTGKIVFVLKRGPRQKDPDSPFFAQKDVSFNRVDEKIKTAIEKGAAGILLVTDPLHNRMLTPRGFPWPNLYKGFPPDAVPVTLARMEGEKIPAVQVGEEAIRQLFGSIETLKQLQHEIDSTMTPHSFPIQGASAQLHTTTRQKVQVTSNVAGWLEGSDPKLKQEVLVIGAHYDHVGYRKNSSAGEDSVYNGADDNASGTAGLMAVARAFAAAARAHKRSVLFIAFAGEEKGLFGSSHYVAEPLLPLEKTVAMLNLDMIGRNHIDSLSVTGARSSVELATMLKSANKATGFILQTSNDKYLRGGSDHAPFVRKGIPVLFYFAGEHADYHKVSDEVAKINFAKVARVSELCFRTAWKVVQARKRPLYIDVTKPNTK